MVDDETNLPDDDETTDDEAPAAAPATPAQPVAAMPQTLPSVAAAADQPMPAGTSPLAQPPPMNQTVLDYLQAQQAKMAAAQQQSGQNQLGVGLARAGATLGTALSGAKPANESAFDDLDQQAKSPVNDLMAKQKQTAGDIAIQDKLKEAQITEDESDPDSDSSKRFRATLKSQFPGIAAAYGEDFDDLTAADSKDVLKVAETRARLEEQKGVAGLRNDTARAALDARQSAANDKRTEAQKSQDNKDAIELDNYLSKGWTSRSSQAAGVQGNLNQIDRLEALVNQGKQQDGGLTSSQLEELAVGTSKLLGGGAGSDARVNALVPHTFMGNMQDAASWAENKPKGRDQQAFTDQISDLIAREKEIAQKQKQQFQVEGLPARQRLRQSNPDLFNGIISAKGIDPTMLDENARIKQQAPPQDSSQGDVHQRAAALLAKRQAAKSQQGTVPRGTPQPQGFAYGGMVGGLPSSNFAASQLARMPKEPKLNLHSPRGYAHGGEVKDPRDTAQENKTWIENAENSYASNDPKEDAKVYTGYARGGMIPGRAPVPGDSPTNDNVPIMASPGEYVVPRHIMQGPAGRLIRKMCEGGTV